MTEISVRTCLWFESDGLAAAEAYTMLIPESGISNLHRMTPEAPPLVIDFRLAGVPYQIINGGPMYALTPAASISVSTPDQAETDRLWDALTEGGQEMMCGWLTDRWGVSWQIVPEALPRLLALEDSAAVERVSHAMMDMRKFDIAALEAAAAA